MSAPQKIRNPSFAPSQAQKAAQWSAVRASKLALLRHSDWTQLADAHLTPEHQAAWARWRSDLRQIKSDRFTSPEQYDQAIVELGKTMPSAETDAVPAVQAPVTEEREPSLAEVQRAAIKHCVKITEECLTDIATSEGISLLTYRDVVEEALDLMAEYPDPSSDKVTLNNFPTIKAISEVTNRAPSFIVSDILARQTRMIGVQAYLEAVRSKAIIDISQAQTIQNIQLVLSSFESLLKEI